MNLDTSTQISVLDKYQEQISKSKNSFSYGRNVFQHWNSSKITFLSMIMDKSDLYKFLVEEKFINVDHVSCNKCKGKIVYCLNTLSFLGGPRSSSLYYEGLRWGSSKGFRWGSSKAFVAKTDGIVWACNNKIGSGIYARTFNSTRSVRTNSWFLKIKTEYI